MGQALRSPFFPFLAVTCGFNLPPAVWTETGIKKNIVNGPDNYHLPPESSGMGTPQDLENRQAYHYEIFESTLLRRIECHVRVELKITNITQ